MTLLLNTPASFSLNNKNDDCSTPEIHWYKSRAEMSCTYDFLVVR